MQSSRVQNQAGAQRMVGDFDHSTVIAPRLMAGVPTNLASVIGDFGDSHPVIAPRLMAGVPLNIAKVIAGF